MQLAHELVGTGPPVVLLAGCATERVVWQTTVERLKEHFQVLTLDNRGIGGSPCPAGPYTTEQMADDVAQLMGSLDLEGALLVGHSMGGQIAQQLALHHPTRVRGLTLVCTSACMSRRTGAILHSWVQAMKHDPHMALDVMLPWLFTDDFFSTPGAVETAHQLFQPPNLVGFEAQVQAVLRHDTRSRLNDIKVPTLVLGGEEDPLATADDIGALAEGIGHARVQVLPGSHSLLLEQPEPFHEALLRFARTSGQKLGFRQTV